VQRAYGSFGNELENIKIDNTFLGLLTKRSLYLYISTNQSIFENETHQNPLGSFKDLSIHRDKQHEATYFILCSDLEKKQSHIFHCTFLADY
jgi:hypothetical protein